MSRAWPVDGVDPDMPVILAARRILAVRVAEVYSYRPIVLIPEAVEEIHDLRIALKRLRYTLELFGDLFGEAGAAQIVRVKALQETLGTLHDEDVRLALIATAAAARPERTTDGERPAEDATADIRAGLGRIAGRERARRAETHRRFGEEWAAAQQAGMRRELVALSQPLS